MATSGFSTFNLPFDEIIEEAYERLGRESGAQSGNELRTALRSLNLMFQDWQNRGVNMWLVDQQTLVLEAGVAVYDLDEDTCDVFARAVIRTTANGVSSDREIERIQRDEYLALPDKATSAAPTYYWVERLSDSPVIHFWPVPDARTTYSLIYNRIRYMEDAADYKDNADLPRRFLPALTAGLAYYMAMKTPTIPIDRRQELRADYLDAFKAALDEDRDRGSTYIVPDFSRFYR